MMAQEDWIAVAPLAALAPGVQRTVMLDNTTVLVVNLGDQLSAIEDVCTHDYCPLSGGQVQDGVIVCPRHGARFDLRTGEALCAPAYEPVTVFPTRVVAGIVQVRDHRWD